MTWVCSARHSGELPSTTALDRRCDCSVTHHHWRWALATRPMPMIAHQVACIRYQGERSAWNEMWNRAASRCLAVVLRMPSQVRGDDREPLPAEGRDRDPVTVVDWLRFRCGVVELVLVRGVARYGDDFGSLGGLVAVRLLRVCHAALRRYRAGLAGGQNTDRTVITTAARHTAISAATISTPSDVP